MCKRYIDLLPLLHPLLWTWPETQACALTENQNSDPLVHRLALNPLRHTNQGTLGTFYHPPLSIGGLESHN